MTEKEPPRYFIDANLHARTYRIVDRQTGEQVTVLHDPATAATYCEIANKKDAYDRAYREALNRASGRS